MLLARLTRTTTTASSSSRLIRPSASFVNTNFALSQASVHLRKRQTAAMTTSIGEVAKDVTVSNKRIMQTIMDDHKMINQAYDEIISATDNDGRTRARNHFVWEVARHSVAEELIIYPKFELLGELGKQMAAKDRAEHQEVKETLSSYESMKPDHPDFIDTATKLIEHLREHIKGEEQHDLPALEAQLTADESASLTREFNRMKMLAPSQTHEWTGSQGGWFQTAAGLVMAPIDHVGDLFRKFPHKTISPNPSTK